MTLFCPQLCEKALHAGGARPNAFVRWQEKNLEPLYAKDDGTASNS